MTEIPNFAPGCFGSALAYQEDHSFCQNCKFKEQCKPLHDANLEALRVRCNINKLPKRFEMKPPTQENPYPGAKVLTAKVEGYINRIEHAGIRITESFAAGRNPFRPTTLKFLYLAAHLLLNLKRPVREEMLIAACESKLHCARNTAESYARTALQIFRHVGAVDEVDGGYTLRSF